MPELWPRLLTVPAAARYLSLHPDLVVELLDVGTLPKVTIPAPITAKRREPRIRRVLIDRLELDRLHPVVDHADMRALE